MFWPILMDRARHIRDDQAVLMNVSFAVEAGDKSVSLTCRIRPIADCRQCLLSARLAKTVRGQASPLTRRWRRVPPEALKQAGAGVEAVANHGGNHAGDGKHRCCVNAH